MQRSSEYFGGFIEVGGVADQLEKLVEHAKILGWDAGARTNGNRRKSAWITMNQGSDPLKIDAHEKPSGGWLINISGEFLVSNPASAQRYATFFRGLAQALEYVSA